MYKEKEDYMEFLNGQEAYDRGDERDDTQSLMWVSGWDEAERLDPQQQL